jgi:hypothetical protein
MVYSLLYFPWYSSLSDLGWSNLAYISVKSYVRHEVRQGVVLLVIKKRT